MYRGVCTNYNITWGRGEKGEKLGQIMLIVNCPKNFVLHCKYKLEGVTGCISSMS